MMMTAKEALRHTINQGRSISYDLAKRVLADFEILEAADYSALQKGEEWTKLNAELASLNAKLKDAHDTYQLAMLDQQTELASLRKDKERLDWLIKQGPPGAADNDLGLTEELWELATCQIEDCESPQADGVLMRKAINEAIDAMKGERE